jgi:hypothetical protein
MSRGVVRGARLPELSGTVGESLLEVGADGVAEFGDGGIGDEAHGDEALLAAADHACLGQGLDVAGDIGLGEAGGGDEVGDVFFTFFEGAEDAQAAGFGEDTEPGGDHFESFLGDDGGG